MGHCWLSGDRFIFGKYFAKHIRRVYLKYEIRSNHGRIISKAALRCATIFIAKSSCRGEDGRARMLTLLGVTLCKRQNLCESKTLNMTKSFISPCEVLTKLNKICLRTTQKDYKKPRYTYSRKAKQNLQNLLK